MQRFASRVPVCLALMFVFAFSCVVAWGQEVRPKTKPVAKEKTVAQEQSKANAVQGANAWLEIDSQQFEDNIKLIRKMVGDKVDICAILKADAYGHGLSLLMPSVLKLKIKTIGIASNQEAALVRSFGFKGTVARVRLATLGEIENGMQYDMEELLGNLEQARQVDRIAAKAGVTLRYHLSINSGGMDRNGLDLATKEGKSDALAIAKLSHLKLVGIMTHYAVKNIPEIRQRQALFNEETSWFIKAAKLDRSKITLHSAASYAAVFVPESRCDMVRPGSVLFGTLPQDGRFKSIMSFKTCVTGVNSYTKGTQVGYDHTYTLTRDSRLANLPVGFSDGYRRDFSNRGQVLIRGHRVPVVGYTSMNTTMVDVTDYPDIRADDEVVIYGKQGKDEITRDEICQINHSTFHDMCTLWGNSNPKILKKDVVKK
ncbi:MAG: alanine racemase [Thermoguttaceae bacterium]|nr:alanine racemase [Thermoguttaceae bacterium]